MLCCPVLTLGDSALIKDVVYMDGSRLYLGARFVGEDVEIEENKYDNFHKYARTNNTTIFFDSCYRNYVYKL